MKYSFIGLGNMASAIIAGMAASGKFKNDNIYGYNRSEGKTNTLRDRHGLIPCASALEAVEKAEVVVLCVKPQVMPKLLDEIGGAITKDKLVITIAAGKSCDWYEAKLGKGVPVVRVMPNINATVLEAMSAYCCNALVNDEQKALVEKLCSSFGKVVSIEEDKFSIFSAIAGCSPAYSYMFIDSLARAGVKNGLAKGQALEIAAQTVLGSAKKILESKEHPWELIDRVCSPGGTTIEGVCALQENGFEATVTSAVDASYLKDKSL